jgi:NMD protein affecting ribosome stability and mRNA decay
MNNKDIKLTEKIKCPQCGKVEEIQFSYPLNTDLCSECLEKLNQKEIKGS